MVLLANFWICFQDNQIKICFSYILLTIKEYLVLSKEKINNSNFIGEKLIDDVK